MKNDDLIDRLLDEEDDSTITLYDERGRAVEMAQMALIAVGGEPYPAIESDIFAEYERLFSEGKKED